MRFDGDRNTDQPVAEYVEAGGFGVETEFTDGGEPVAQRFERLLRFDDVVGVRDGVDRFVGACAEPGRPVRNSRLPFVRAPRTGSEPRSSGVRKAKRRIWAARVCRPSECRRRDVLAAFPAAASETPVPGKPRPDGRRPAIP